MFPDTHRDRFVSAYEEKYARLGIDPFKDGSYLQDQLEFAKKQGFITGYYKCENVIDIKTAIDRQRPCVTGSKRIDWRLTRAKPNVAIVSSGSAHLFGIVGYNDISNLLICVNSY